MSAVHESKYVWLLQVDGCTPCSEVMLQDSEELAKTRAKVLEKETGDRVVASRVKILPTMDAIVDKQALVDLLQLARFAVKTPHPKAIELLGVALMRFEGYLDN